MSKIAKVKLHLEMLRLKVILISTNFAQPLLFGKLVTHLNLTRSRIKWELFSAYLRAHRTNSPCICLLGIPFTAAAHPFALLHFLFVSSFYPTLFVCAVRVCVVFLYIRRAGRRRRRKNFPNINCTHCLIQ